MMTGRNIYFALKNESWHGLMTFGIVIALVLIFIYSFIFNSYTLFSMVSSYNDEINKITHLHQTTSLDQTKINSNTVKSWNLFGIAPIVQSNNHFVLFGIEYTNQDPSKARAIMGINSETGEGEIYRVGDKLPQGAIINSIDSKHVVLFYNGSQQSISLQWNENENNQNVPMNPMPQNPGVKNKIPSNYKILNGAEK